MAGELVDLLAVFRAVLNLESDNVDSHSWVMRPRLENDEVRRTGRIIDVPVGELFLDVLSTLWDSRWMA